MDNDHGEAEFSLKDWDLRDRICTQNTSSRRFSARTSGLSVKRRGPSDRISSSPAPCPPLAILSVAKPLLCFRIDVIDPSTYLFTNALKALQAKQGYVIEWDDTSPEGFVLNSKWSDAERYICNPSSGEVPLECLSAKILGQRSCRSMRNRFTMSAPLVYPSNYAQHVHLKSPPPTSVTVTRKNTAQVPVQEKKAVGRTRDVGTQSTPSNVVRSSSPSPTSTPSIGERKVKRSVSEAEDSPNSNSKAEEKEEVDDERTMQRINDKRVEGKDEIGGGEGENSHDGQVYSCLSWMMVMRKKKKKRQREKKLKPRRKHKLLFLPSKKGC